MSAFLYGTALQLKLDIRSKTMLITCYVVPLMFFAFMGGIFTSINPLAKETLIQSMTVFGISMGALIGTPPPLLEIYSSEIKNVYKANHVPLFWGIVSNYISSFIHLSVMSLIILGVAPMMFDAALPTNLPLHFGALFIYLASALSVGCVLGLLCKKQSKLTMVSQLFFLPSIMLSGIMFPVSMLPAAFANVGKLFPAYWGYELMQAGEITWGRGFPLLLILAAAVLACGVLLRVNADK